MAGQDRIVERARCLPVQFYGILGHHNGIDHASRYDHALPRDGCRRDKVLDLGDHLSAHCLDGHGNVPHIDRRRFLFHGNIAVFICRCPADEADIQLRRPVEKVFFTADIRKLHDILFGRFIEPAALLAGIAEGIKADPGKLSLLSACSSAVHMGDDPLRQIVGTHLVLIHQFHHFVIIIEMTADISGDQTLFTHGDNTLFLTVAVSRRMHDRKAGRMAARTVTFPDCRIDLCRRSGKHGTRYGDIRTVRYHSDSFFHRDSFILHLLFLLMKDRIIFLCHRECKNHAISPSSESPRKPGISACSARLDSHFCNTQMLHCCTLQLILWNARIKEKIHERHTAGKTYTPGPAGPYERRRR